MKKLVIGASVVFLAAFGYKVIWPALMATPCGTENLKVSTTEINLKDRQFVKLALGRRFGNKVGSYTKRMKSANNSMVFMTDKNKPWLSIFSTSYKSEGTAARAFNHLKNKYQSSDKQQFHVVKDGKTVALYSNHKLSQQCFFQVVDAQQGASDRALAAAPTDKPQRKLAKPKTRKTIAKKKRLKKKKRSAHGKKSAKPKQIAKRQRGKKYRKISKKKSLKRLVADKKR